MGQLTKAELLAKAEALGIEGLTEENTVKEIQAKLDEFAADTEPVTPAPAPEPATSAPVDSTAAAIVEGMKAIADGNKKKIKITVDRGIEHRFSVVKSKSTGKIMVRENATGLISEVQMQSLEEKKSEQNAAEYEER